MFYYPGLLLQGHSNFPKTPLFRFKSARVLRYPVNTATNVSSIPSITSHNKPTREMNNEQQVITPSRLLACAVLVADLERFENAYLAETEETGCRTGGS